MVPSPHIYFNHRSLLLYVGDGKWQSICDMADSSYKYYIFILLLHLSTYHAPTNGHTPHFFIVFLGKKLNESSTKSSKSNILCGLLHSVKLHKHMQLLINP
jgi:hypothetical protein